jgi:hypothetical protein
MVPRYGARGLWGVAWNWTRMVRISGSKMKEATANDFLKSGAGRRNRTTDTGIFSYVIISGDFPPFSNPYVSNSCAGHGGICWVLLGDFWLGRLQFSYSAIKVLTFLGRAGWYESCFNPRSGITFPWFCVNDSTGSKGVSYRHFL